MDITAKLEKLLPEQSGTSAAGSAWKKTVAIFDIGGKFNDKLAITFFNSEPPTKIGDTYNLNLNVKSREYGLNWYTEATCWRFTEVQSVSSTNQSVSNAINGQPVKKFETPKDARNAAVKPLESEPLDDLPFMWVLPLIPFGGLLAASSSFLG